MRHALAAASAVARLTSFEEKDGWLLSGAPSRWTVPTEPV